MATKQKNRPKDLEIVLRAPSETGKLQLRLNLLRSAASKAGLKPSFAVAQFSDSPLSDTRALPWNKGQDEWAVILSAAQETRAKYLLFWPDCVTPNPEILFGLYKAGRHFDWVTDTRGELSLSTRSCLAWAWGLPPQDFGSACLLRVKLLKDLKLRLSLEDALLAPRLARRAARSGAKFGQLATRSHTQLSFFQALGIDWKRKRTLRTDNLALSVALLATGMALPKPAILSLILFIIGFLGLGYSFGKPE